MLIKIATLIDDKDKQLTVFDFSEKLAIPVFNKEMLLSTFLHVFD